MPMVTLQILKPVDFTKTQESKYLENETYFLFKSKNFVKSLKSDVCMRLLYYHHILAAGKLGSID